MLSQAYMDAAARNAALGRTRGALPVLKTNVAPGATIDERLEVQPGTGAVPNGSIVAPPPPSLVDSVNSIKASGLLPDFQSVSYNPVGDITNTLDDNYFNTLEANASKKLNDKYFGDAADSLQRQQQMNINRRGLIGSGIEQGAIRGLNKSFGDELVNLQGDLAAKRAEAEQNVAFKNKDIALSNAANSLAADQKDREFKGFLAELGLRSGADEEKTLGAYNSDIFKSKVEEKNNASTNSTNLMDQLNKALGNELIDPETRQTFEDIFGSNVTSAFGYHPSPSQVAAQQKGQAAQPKPPTTPGQVGEMRRGADGGQYVYTTRGTWVQV